MREISELADAVVMAWYPGQEGGQALADLLFGDADFSGRLPVTFPTDVDKLPSFDDYSMMGRTYKYMTDNIFYPFGYGLSYGRVVYRGATAVRKGDDVVVEVELKNEAVRRQLTRRYRCMSQFPVPDPLLRYPSWWLSSVRRFSLVRARGSGLTYP